MTRAEEEFYGQEEAEKKCNVCGCVPRGEFDLICNCKYEGDEN